MVLDVHRLRLLSELAQRGTLAAVAKALSYSPSAVSQQLSQLEVEAGVPLLERVGRGVRLTAQGHVLVEHADAVLQRLEVAQADLAASVSEVRGTVRVAAFSSALLRLVPPAVTSSTSQHPHLRLSFVHLQPEESSAALLAHDVDLVLGEEYPGLPLARQPGVHEEQLGHDELRLAAPAGSAPGHDPLVALTDTPWAMDPADSASGRWQRGLCRSAGFEPDVRYETPDPLMQANLVRSGHAAALVPDLLATGQDLGVRLLPLPGHPTRRLYTGTRVGAAAHPAVRAARESLNHALRTAQPPAG
ncbi:LysR family transcriptional regulator [uncultured Pseudokineococcus sp.]|uniref:LysR family transcriptional regulator n=1 Tax=uncultured Pseudokineococcus sp. TaxID=1642928 RepID=UPI00261985FB|nr:LysR family transcriptional regulator [uncultured Pseudokineococcus sp.]